MIAYIYKITNLVNGMSYIGQTTRPINRRWWEHKYNYIQPIDKAIEEFGEENFTLEILKEAEAGEVSNYWETFYINKLDTFLHGYNGSSFGTVRREPVDCKQVRELWDSGLNMVEISQTIECGDTLVAKILRDSGISDKNISARAVESRTVSVVQIELHTGNIINIFSSTTDALKSVTNDINRTNPSNITNVCSNKCARAYGFYWRYLTDVDKSDLDTMIYSGELPDANRYVPKTPERKYDYSEIYELYKSGFNCNKIADIIGCSNGTVSKALDECGVSTEERIKRNRPEIRSLKQIDVRDNHVIATYHSASRAAELIHAMYGISATNSNILRACKSNKVAYGYKWEYA